MKNVWNSLNLLIIWKILHIALRTGYSYTAISKRLDITTLKLILKLQRFFFETITGKAENVYFAHERTFLSQCDGSTDILQIFQPIINIIIVNQHVLWLIEIFVDGWKFHQTDFRNTVVWKYDRAENI